jgi:tetratricopeptide (TPR) repeat protein
LSSAKFGALFMSALVVMYLVLVAERSFALIGSGEAIGIAIGSLMIFLPAVAFWGIFMELRFGLRIEKLGEVLKQENAWPQFPFELRPSGRPTKESAQEVFEQFRQRVISDESNWKAWFALGLAYDAAGDRPRARKAMRRAISLANDSKAF